VASRGRFARLILQFGLAGSLASYVEARDPPPWPKRSAWKFQIEYPTGSCRPPEIELSELYQALRARLDRERR
jgi:hypothetical protein